MWTKILMAVLGMATALMAFFTYYAWSWLQSVGLPIAAFDGYKYHSTIAGITLLLATPVLLVLSNLVFWMTGRLWPLWTTFAFFAVFVAVRFFWLEHLGVAFFEDVVQGFDESGPAWFKPAFAVVVILGMAAIVFTNQITLIRRRAKSALEPFSTVESEVVKLP